MVVEIRGFSLSSDLARPLGQSFLKLFGWELSVSHHSTMFGDHKDFGIGYLMALFCHVISHDHAVKGLSHFLGRSPSR